MTALTHRTDFSGELMPEKAVLKQWPCLSLDGLRAARAAEIIAWVKGSRSSVWYRPEAVLDYIKTHLEIECIDQGAPQAAPIIAEVDRPVLNGIPRGPRYQVYFIHCKATKAIKIGIGREAKVRMRNLQTGCAEKLTLLGWFWGSEHDEKDAHARFHIDRLSGEWFKDTPVLRTYIAEVTAR